MADRVCCLYRVSTTKQVDHDELNQADIPVQRKACHEFIERMGWTLVIEEQEAGISGFKVSANDRDKIQQIKEYALQDKFDILLVFMFDRIGRRAEETPFVVEWLIQHNIRVWSVNEGEQRIDSHVDRLTNYIRFWQADGESQKTSMRTKAALGQMVQEGRFRGGIAPYGYKLVPSGIFNKRKKEVMKLEIEESEANVIKLIFDLCITSGYGRWKLAMYLNEKGIKNRNGNNWHDATIGHILHNIMYTGVLRSGETQSEIIPELQIINPQDFEMAQKLMMERKLEFQKQRTMPRKTSGQALLSGNVFCGHCGGRLILTSSVKSNTNTNGEQTKYLRVRYSCYNKTRKRAACDGQTGYTTHILDKLVTDVLHEIFRKMKAVSEDEVVKKADRNMLQVLKENLLAARIEYEKAEKEYETLKNEVLKALQGESAFQMTVLSELVEAAREKMKQADEKVIAMNKEAEAGKLRTEAIRNEYKRILQWAEMFDSSDMEVKKMIAGYIIKRVEVYENYRLHLEFNMSIEQFNLGLDIPSEYNMQSVAV